jgi:hypothetical protein
MATQREDGRRSDRLKVILVAKLNHDDIEARVRILDLSRHGALISGHSLPAVGSPITLECGTQAVSGSVAWRNRDQAGLSFNKQVSRQGFARKTQITTELLIKDTRAIDFRRPGFRGNQLTAEERAFMAQLASGHQIQSAARRGSLLIG